MDPAATEPDAPLSGPTTTGSRHTPAVTRRSILFFWLSGAALLATWQIARSLRGLLIQLLVSLFLAFAIEPAVDRLERAGLRRGIGTGVMLVVIIGSVVGFVAAMGSVLATQITDLAQGLPGYLVSIEEWAEDRFGLEVATDDLIERIETGEIVGRAADVAQNLVGVGSTVLNGVLQVFTILLFTFYLAADGPRLRRTICSVLPPRRQHEVLRVWELATNKTGAFISSRFVMAVISSIFHTTVFWLLDLPSAVALGLWVGIVSQFVPVVGTYLAGLFPVVIALGAEPVKALWVIVAVIAYQQVENYVIQPRITSQTLAIHPAVAFGAVLAGAGLLGPIGAILALPFAATLQGVVSAYVQRHEFVGSAPSAMVDPNDAVALAPTHEPAPEPVPDTDVREDPGPTQG